MSVLKPVSSQSVVSTLQSLSVDLVSKKVSFIESDQVALSVKLNLSVLRGQAVFTSAFSLTNDYGEQLFFARQHYDRLLYSYQVMFEQNRLPFDFQIFQSYVTDLIAQNRRYNQEKYLQILIFILAGDAKSDGYGDNIYKNGFGGQAAQVLFVTNKMTYKCAWTFEQGLNVIGIAYKREMADAKPTLYLGGIKGQHIIDTLNTILCLDLLNSGQFDGDDDRDRLELQLQKKRKEVWDTYSGLSVSEQRQLRFFMHDLRFGRLEGKALSDLVSEYEITSPTLLDLVESVIHVPDVNASIRKVMKVILSSLYHETIFISQGAEPNLLEGATFAILGIDAENVIRFIPLSHSGDGNSGEAQVVLESVSILLIKQALSRTGFKSVEAPIPMSELRQFKSLFAVSATRIFKSEGQFCMQPIHSINGFVLSGGDSISREMKSKIESSVAQELANYRS